MAGFYLVYKIKKISMQSRQGFIFLIHAKARQGKSIKSSLRLCDKQKSRAMATLRALLVSVHPTRNGGRP
jgi:hypothetical protein